MAHKFMKHFILLKRKEKGLLSWSNEKLVEFGNANGGQSGKGISGRRKGINEGMEKGLGVERGQHREEDNGE